MNTPQDKLSKLAGLLGGVDETEPVQRPVGRGIGKILPIDREPADMDDAGESAGVTEAPLTAPALPTRDPTPRRARRQTTTKPQSTAAAGKEPLVRSTALLPSPIDDALTRAKRDRWGVTELVNVALAKPQVAEADAGRSLATYADSSRAMRAYRLSSRALDQVDALGAEWRMNRTQVLTVLLDSELTARGYL